VNSQSVQTDSHASLPDAYRRLVAIQNEMANLEHAAALLVWDQRTYMPSGGAESRGEQQATLATLAHAKSTSAEVGELLARLADYEAALPFDSDEASLIRVSRRQYEKATRIPTELVAEHSRAATAGYDAWQRARQARDFALFRPELERLVPIMQRITDALGYDQSPLDPLIDMSEPGVTAAECESLFAQLRAGLVPLVAAIVEASPGDEDRLIRQHYPADAQMAMGREAVAAVGFDAERTGRVDLTIHPFTITLGAGDVRITTRVREDDFSDCLYSLLHEAGHGVYEQGLPARFYGTPLFAGSSSGFHESQSRLWENVVGRSLEFWTYFMPTAQRYFSEQLAAADARDMYRAVNRVTPSLIRTEADEVTYNLHVMLRFELEKSLLEGTLAVKDLRDAWNDRMSSYLGITPPSDLEGVLQDVHWSRGPGGGFQGYTMGNVIAMQLFEAAEKAYPGLRDDFASGRFERLFDWMRANVHAHGAKYTPGELLNRLCGTGLDAAPYLRYLTDKYTRLYSL